ncbi:MAG: UpxY family transcription antiterminator [Armatimonadetes bacterium]|nr:UpxY family transcription antiterminator [Armatimonadota bacterium]
MRDGAMWDRYRERWYAIFTKVNYEKRVFSALNAMGFKAFLPCIKVWSRRRDELIEKPAFPRYLFVRCVLTKEAYLAIKKALGVLKFVDCDGIPTPIPDEEIESVRIVLNGANEVEGHPFLKVGDLVEVVKGRFKGARGYLMEIGKRHKLIVGIEMLGRAVSVNIDASMVRKLESYEI